MNRRFKFYLLTLQTLLLSSPVISAMETGSCAEEVEFGQTIQGEWVADCKSTLRSDTSDPYNPKAFYEKFYTFELARDTDVSIKIYGGSERYIYLYNGKVTSASNDNERFRSLIERNLKAGTYTIELTSIWQTSFQLELNYNEFGTDECFRTIELGDVITDGWTASCKSQNSTYHDPYSPQPEQQFRAKFFQFNVDSESDLRIDVQSDKKEYWYLLEGNDQYGEILHQYNWSQNRVLTLDPGSYVLELTTQESYSPGAFTLQLEEVGAHTLCNKPLVFDSWTYDEWSPRCLSQSGIDIPHDPYAGTTRRANYYTFSLDEPTEVSLSNQSHSEKAKFIIISDETPPRIIATNVNQYATQREIIVRLEPGSYTLEVSPPSSAVKGSYAFRASMLLASGCLTEVQPRFEVTGLLTPACDSAFRKPINHDINDPYSPELSSYYGKQFSFNVGSDTTINADITLSNGNGYIYLVRNFENRSIIIDKAVEHNGYYDRGEPMISRHLLPGDYILEATSAHPFTEEKFKVSTNTFGSSCLRDIALNEAYESNMYNYGDCRSVVQDSYFNDADPYGPSYGYQHYYAKWFSFLVTEEGLYEIYASTTNFKSIISLFTGSRPSDAVIHESLQVHPLENRSSVWLTPGFYTYEITSTTPEVTGKILTFVATTQEQISPPASDNTPDCLDTFTLAPTHELTGSFDEVCTVDGDTSQRSVFYDFYVNELQQLTFVPNDAVDEFRLFIKFENSWLVVFPDIPSNGVYRKALPYGDYRLELIKTSDFDNQDFSLAITSSGFDSDHHNENENGTAVPDDSSDEADTPETETPAPENEQPEEPADNADDDANEEDSTAGEETDVVPSTDNSQRPMPKETDSGGYMNIWHVFMLAFLALSWRRREKL